jgi:hypothetical protein
VVVATAAFAVLSPHAAAGPVSPPEDLLLSAAVLERIGVTPGDGVERPLPARPECSAIRRTTALSAPAVTATTARRSTDRRGDVLTDEVVRVFETPGAARAFVQPFRDEDPAEECVEALVAKLVSDRGFVLDTFADDRTVALGGAPGVAYLAEATYADGDRELKVRAEQIIGRIGDTVVDVLVLAPERDFVEVATRVERDLAARLRAARQ